MNDTALDTRRQAAEARLRVIRNALEVADDELERAFVERDWETLKFGSWEAYCAAIPEFRHFTMKAGPRRERVRWLRAAGANIPQVKAATGSSLGTIHRDVQASAPAPATARWRHPATATSTGPMSWWTRRRSVTSCGPRSGGRSRTSCSARSGEGLERRKPPDPPLRGASRGVSSCGGGAPLAPAMTASERSICRPVRVRSSVPSVRPSTASWIAASAGIGTGTRAALSPFPTKCHAWRGRRRARG